MSNCPVHVPIRDLPQPVQSLLGSLGYHRSDVEVIASETVSPLCSGGAGRRGFFAALDLAEPARVQVTRGSWGGATMFSPTNAVDLDSTERPVRPGVVFVKGYEGGQVSAVIYAHPATLVKALPAPAETSPRERWILAVVDGLISSYRKEYLARGGVQPAELDALVARGLLKRNKVGAISITTKGRNARGDAQPDSRPPS